MTARIHLLAVYALCSGVTTVANSVDAYRLLRTRRPKYAKPGTPARWFGAALSSGARS